MFFLSKEIALHYSLFQNVELLIFLIAISQLMLTFPAIVKTALARQKGMFFNQSLRWLELEEMH